MKENREKFKQFVIEQLKDYDEWREASTEGYAEIITDEAIKLFCQPAVVGSALSPQYCRDCKYYPDPKTLTYENHLKCKHCVFIGNQQSNFEPKSV